MIKKLRGRRTTPQIVVPETRALAPRPVEHRAASRDVFALENLLRAWKRVRANGGAPGMDGETLRAFEENLRANLDALQGELKTGVYQPRGVRMIPVPKASGGYRPLTILAVRDRVAQRVVYDALAPVYEQKFLDCSFGFREGRSLHDAVAVVTQHRDEGRKWVVDGDIKDCFERLDHGVLLRALRQDVRDARLVNLIAKWLKARVMRDLGRGTAIGTYQGGVISPLLANVYLHAFDVELTRAGLALVRYADDWVILSPRKMDAESALERAARVLERLKLLVNPHKTRIVHFDEGFSFVGMFFVRNKVYPISPGARVKDEGERER
ncbi:MAG: group II intron reverse transcriptase/maturase [Chloroflexi bacterium]|nr:group II intron reverse transcriptase/maturase [Chloroflexota bacterium]